MKKWKPYSAKWEAEANLMARCRTPQMYPCRVCGGPVIDGYVCGHCGEESPKDDPLQRKP